MNTKKKILNRYRKTPKGVITDMYNHHKYRNRKNGFGEVGYTLKWLQEKYLTDKLFLRLFDEWVKSGYEKAKKPTIDRINNKKDMKKIIFIFFLGVKTDLNKIWKEDAEKVEFCRN